MADSIILASASPRRQELLAQMGLEFGTRPQDVDETFAGLSAEEEAVRLAEKKVQACINSADSDTGSNRHINSGWVLGADTFIEHQGRLIGKPVDRTDAKRMLQMLSGSIHSVITGLALKVPPGMRIETAFCRTEVLFSPLSDNEIEWYLNTEEWMGAAAAYRIQEKGAVFIESISGSYSNVMGLPINTFYGMLCSNNFNFRD